MAEEVTMLYRPVGKKELELIRASGFREFPPRLPSQPFFYPVTNEEYAIQIARDWNTKDEASGFEGHVLRFAVRAGFLSDLIGMWSEGLCIVSIGFRRASWRSSIEILWGKLRW
jgi:hypothetical protein